jgi:5'-3' exonuclease
VSKVLLIDGLNFIYRANVGFKPKDKSTIDYTIVYNLFRNLRATIEQFSPTNVFFCLEGKNNFRYKLFADYKANRIIKTGVENKSYKKENFIRQADIVINLLPYLPVISVKADGYEADDVIATLADNLKEEDTIIISTDTDYIQLLQKDLPRLQIYNPTPKEFIFPPDYHYLTYKILAGDTSDNIPSITNKEVAIELASDPKKLLNYLNNQEKQSNYKLNYSLINLQPIDNDLLQFTDYKVNYNLLKEEFVKMGFPSMVEEKYWERFVETFESIR